MLFVAAMLVLVPVLLLLLLTQSYPVTWAHMSSCSRWKLKLPALSSMRMMMMQKLEPELWLS
jgi:hypothetical protein